MPLQVRLRHALGEKVLELPGRGADQPIVIGRSPQADIQVPSVSIAPTHAVLFVHEGQWVAQPISGTIGINGQRVSQPVALQIGDVITLGQEPSPPLLQIDPLGAAEGRSGLAREGLAAPAPAYRAVTPASAPAYPPAPEYSQAPAYASGKGYAPAPAPAPAPVPAYAQQPADYDQQAVAPEDPDTIEWNAADSVPKTTTYYIPKQKSSSEATIAFAAVFALVVLGGAGVFVYLHTRPPAPPPPAVAPPPVVREVRPRTDRLFDLAGDQAAARAQQQQTPTPHADNASNEQTSSQSDNNTPDSNTDSSPPSPSNTSSTAAPATAPDQASPAVDAAWQAVENAHNDVRHQDLAILKYDEYRRTHPGQFTQKLDQFTDEAVNWLWWQRVAQLYNRRERINGDLAKLDRDLKAQPPGSFHDQLEKQKVDLQKQKDETEDFLGHEFAYTQDQPPDLNSPSKLEELAKTRDPGRYAKFKDRTVRHILNNHGQVPWAGEDD